MGLNKKTAAKIATVFLLNHFFYAGMSGKDHGAR